MPADDVNNDWLQVRVRALVRSGCRSCHALLFWIKWPTWRSTLRADSSMCSYASTRQPQRMATILRRWSSVETPGALITVSFWYFIKYLAIQVLSVVDCPARRPWILTRVLILVKWTLFVQHPGKSLESLPSVGKPGEISCQYPMITSVYHLATSTAGSKGLLVVNWSTRSSTYL